MSTPATSHLMAALATAALAAGATAASASAAADSHSGGPCDTRSHGGPGGGGGGGGTPPPPGTIICIGGEDHHRPPPPPPPPLLVLPPVKPVETAAANTATPAPVILVSPQTIQPQLPVNTAPAPPLRMGRLAGLELASWSDDGVVAIEATCGDGAGACAGTVRFQTRRRRHGHLQTVALGSRTFEIAAGQSGLIQVKLAHAARRLIARSGVLKIAVTTRSGQSTSRTFDV